MSTGTIAESRSDRGFLGHPTGLRNLFFVELWERFSYYGMRAILVYYLYTEISQGGLGLDKGVAQSVVAVYGAAVYLLSIVGGFTADRLIGARMSVLVGGVVIMAGHLALAVPATAASWLGIVLVALGTGLLKPNISAMVGSLYDEEDPRRDAGFQVFYMSVNIGSFFAPLVVSALRARWGFHVGFSAAAVGMALALILFVRGRSTLRGAGEIVPSPVRPEQRGRVMAVAVAAVVAFAALVGVATLWAATPLRAVVDAISIVALVAPIVYFTIMFRSRQVSATERRHLRAYLPIWVGAMLFWMIFEQAAGKMATFADENTDLMGFISPEWFQSVNPLTVVVLTPLFAWLWTSRAGRFPSTPMKFALGVTIVGVSALLLSAAFSVYSVDGGPNRAPFFVLGSVFIIQTVAELCVSPVGLSATTMLAPRAFASQSLAVWYLATSAGQALAAQSIALMDDLPDSTYYLVVGGITLVAAALLFALVPWTRRNMQDIEDRKRRAHDDDVASRRG